MVRLIYWCATIVVAPALFAAGGFAHSAMVPVCTDARTRAFCIAVRDRDLTVAFWGDSITAGKSQIQYANSWAGLTEQYIANELPTVDATFVNLSVDGMGVGNMVGAAQPILDGIPWSEAVKATKPDLLFIAIGMNSNGDAFPFGQILQDRVRFVKSWPISPTIVLVTPIVPTNDEESGAARPEWVDADAMQVRTIADEEGVLLADANAAHHFWAAAAENPRIYLSNGATGNGINHPSDIGHHRLLYTPVSRLLRRAIDSFD